MKKDLQYYEKQGEKYTVRNGQIVPASGSSNEFKQFCENRNNFFKNAFGNIEEEAKARKLAGLD